MRRRTLAIMLCLALLVSAFPMAVFPTAALADGTTEVHVVKYAPDGTTVLGETTKTWEWMRDNMPVYGDGETHYYYQGPAFEGEWQVVHPGETWDSTPICAGDTIPGTSIMFDNAPACIEAERWNPEEDTNCGGPEGAVPKDLGAVQGTSVNDLCGLVGGLSAGDTVRVKASDGFWKEFPAEIFMDPPATLGEGVVCWYTKDCTAGFTGTAYVPEYGTGMRLAFLADTSTNPWGRHIFGIKDMVENLPSNIWHYYYGGTGDFYPACGGYQVKYVSDIEIYSSEEPSGWELTLEGASTYVMAQSEFEDGVECHGATTWVDDTDTWSGLPLWRLVGYVDDDVQHGEGAFNDDLAAMGYDINVIADDGYSMTFSSTDVARNDDMIVANILNGAPLPDDYSPLRLVGPDLTGGQKVSQIIRIELVNIPGGDTSASLNASATVILPTVGIAVEPDNIDYGEVGPGESSVEELASITNVGTSNVEVTLEIAATTAVAQDFYEQSLYIDAALYDPAAVIAEILPGNSEEVVTQLQVPAIWSDPGTQEANFVFWAEASP